MIVYEREIKDGIAELIKTSASVCFESPLTIIDSSQIGVAKAEILTIANPNQIDLHYLNAVLASTGWNKNDDVFDKYETWKARKSGVNKPFNFMHDGNDIIGHITGSVILNQDGSIVDDECAFDDIPDSFDVLVSSVIYKYWPEESRIEEIQQLIGEIEEGKWFVSMECLFPSFDYALYDDEGNQHVIARTEETSFLTKHLRIYGGEGVYQGYKVGRLLRNFTFSGKGLVDKPANPRSVIFNNSIVFNGSEASVKVFSETEGNIIMTDTNLQAKVDELETKLAASIAENVTLQAKASEETKKSYEDTIAGLEAEISAIKASLTEKETTVAELQKTVEESNQAVASKEVELSSIKAEMVKTARANKLTQAGVASEEVDEVLTKFASASDEMFETIVSLYSEAKKNCAKKEDKMEDAKCEETKEEDKAAANTPAEVVVVEEPADKALATEGEVVEQTTAQTRAIAIEALKSSVFKTTRNKTK